MREGGDIAGVISGTGGLVVNGGELDLAGANTFSGGITVGPLGQLCCASDTLPSWVDGNGNTQYGDLTVDATAHVYLQGGEQYIGDLYGNGEIDSGTTGSPSSGSAALYIAGSVDDTLTFNGTFTTPVDVDTLTVTTTTLPTSDGEGDYTASGTFTLQSGFEPGTDNLTAWATVGDVTLTPPAQGQTTGGTWTWSAPSGITVSPSQKATIFVEDNGAAGNDAAGTTSPSLPANNSTATQLICLPGTGYDSNDPDAVEVGYEINGSASPPFTIGIYGENSMTVRRSASISIPSATRPTFVRAGMQFPTTSASVR